ncbi:MAG: DEAD/DEAH box helicase family protein [Planctomycetota bacterium]
MKEPPPSEPKPTNPTDRESILQSIASEESALDRLDQERQAIQARLERLKAKMATLGAEPCVRIRPQGRVVIPPAPATPAEKVALFRSLFRGREDVFPKFWNNPKTGKKGYSPACANEWVRGTCEKPKVKCGECSRQSFLPVTDQVVQEHLQGRFVIGVYPLLKDETCWFLAVDFDKASWAEDVTAFAATCWDVGVPVAVERSRSGNGAHAWFFFSAPVPAGHARKMGCYLLTETMVRRHQLSMASYDRLFPNQDTMPKGGFGNLIALPLQHGPRQKGNTLFLDENLQPYPDPWAFLASVQRLDTDTVEMIAREATLHGQVLGLQSADVDGDEEAAAPWARAPSRKPKPLRISGPIPSEVRAVLSQKLFVEKAGLPSPLANQVKRLAAFQNPEFFKRQNMRFSTAMTPRIISCAEDLPKHIALPRGCRESLETLLQGHGSRLVVEGQRTEGEALDVQFDGELTPIQEEAVKSLFSHDFGVFVAPPGIGKTVVGAYLAAKRGRSTLVLVHRRPLLEQWVAQLSMFLGVDEKAIGQIGGGKRKPNGRLDVAMLQSLVRGSAVDDAVASYGHVIVDECHHVPAVSFERVLAEVKAKYVTGLTATPHRRDGHHPIMEMYLGPIRFQVDPKSQAARRPFEHKLIVRETAFQANGSAEETGIQGLYRSLAADGNRNDLILNDAIGSLKEGRSPILLTERKDHLEFFAEKLRNFARHLVVLHGSLKGKSRREAIARLASIPDGEERLVLATGRYIGEGFDDARLDTLFLALPISWKGTIAQYAGRLQRLHPGKTEVRIFDYVDRDVPVLLKMFQKRLRVYRAIGYAQGEAPLGYGEPSEEPMGGTSRPDSTGNMR